MEIRCKSSKRFLAEVDIENYYKSLLKMGIDSTLPLVMKFACPRCKMIEEYEIYPTHYVHKRSYKKDIANAKVK